MDKLIPDPPTESTTPLDEAIFENRQDVQEILKRAGGVRHTTLGKQ